tara:strand:+ start:1592 stop:1717 length:126 start_codon:yes stop_codon:yes gene_type:complete
MIYRCIRKHPLIPPDRHSDFGKVQSSAIKFDGNIKVYACHL